MAHLAVVYGEWITKDNAYHFEVDNRRGGRMWCLSDGLTHEELVEMAQDEYKIDKTLEFVKLSYSLPNSMLQQMPPDTPPMHVTNNRGVQNLIELSRTHVIRLCVESGVDMDSGGSDGDYNVNVDKEEESGEEEEGSEEEESGEEEEGGEKEEGGEEEEGFEDQYENASNVGAAANGGIKVEFKEEYEVDLDDDYSEYGKIKDEDEDDIPFEGHGTGCVGGPSSLSLSDGIVVNRSFSTKEELQRELRLTAVMLRFAFKVYKSTPVLFIAKCRVKRCRWRVRAAVKNEAERFWVTKYLHIHSCSTADRIAHRKNTTPKYIGRLFLERVGLINGITPEHIKNSMDKMFGMKMNYTTAYGAVVHARELVRGTPESGYADLPSYLHLIKEANPGTVTVLEVYSINRFKYLFITFGASIAGFQYLKRVIVVDGTHLSGKYEGVMLVAAAQDANFQIFPLAFGIVDNENDASWEWFFTKLSTCISDASPLVIVSDRCRSIENACEKVLPWATRGICYYHLQCNIVKKFRGKDLLYLVKGAAYSYTKKDYDRYMDAIRSVKPELADYLEGADPTLWSRVHCVWDRYNVKTSNIAESINAALKVARGYPVVFLLEFICAKLGRWFYKRREDAHSLTTRHSRGVEYLLTIRDYYSSTMTATHLRGWVFEVKAGNRKFEVNLEKWSCSCGVFQTEKIPCTHGIAALTECRQHVSTAVCATYSKEYLYGTYYRHIGPPTMGLKSPDFGQCEPPFVAPHPGQKKKSRWQTWLVIASRKGTKPRKLHNSYNCSNCKKPGHTKKRVSRKFVVRKLVVRKLVVLVWLV